MAKYIEYYDKFSSLAYVISCDIKRNNEELISLYDKLAKNPKEDIQNRVDTLLANIEALSIMLNKVNSLSEYSLNLHKAQNWS